jgi:HPt (histidine-containing phosphotransfer) domain-containing protein
MMSDLSIVLAHTRKRFLGEAQERVLMWSGKDLRVLVSKRSSEPTDSFGAYVHRVAGIATTLGFTELGDAAARLELAIKKYLLGKLAADQLEEDVEEFLTELALVSIARAA